MLIKKEMQMNYEIRLSLTSCELANISPLIFIRILSLVFNASWLFWIKIDLLFLILWKSKRPIASDNLSGKITLGYLTKPRASDGLWWSLQLWDNIEKKWSLGINSVDWNSEVQFSTSARMLFLKEECQQYRKCTAFKPRFSAGWNDKLNISEIHHHIFCMKATNRNSLFSFMKMVWF